MNKKDIEALQTNEEKEQFVLDFCRENIESCDFETLLKTVTDLQSNWNGLTTARLTKIIRNIFEIIPINMKTYEGILLFLDGLIRWSDGKKMLKLDLECKQIYVFLSIGKYKDCLEKIASVIKDLKKYDDKTNLISIYVYESRAYYELKDFAKARSSLTSARALAVSVACPPQLQAQIDVLNGMYISDERVYDTAVSYFLESLEGFVQDKMYENAKVPLRYIVLCKIISGKYDEIPVFMESKHVSKISDDDFTKVLLQIAEACHNRELCQYRDLLSNNGNMIETDSFIYKHLQYLYNILLDNNIIKVIEPYSHIKVKFIGEKLGFEEGLIEDKLRKMILDKKINGILDHATQCLILFDHNDEQENHMLKNMQILEQYYGNLH